MAVNAKASKRLNNGETSPDIQILSLAAPIRHALRGLGYLAGRPEESFRVAQVARALSLPSAALSKSFQRLANVGLLESRRGPGGGYRLSGGPSQTTLFMVAQALDVQGQRLGHCVLEDRPCRGDEACVLHHSAQEADARLRRELSRLTLADLAAAVAARKRAR
jgi:Rrf2 family transcriptional regulator, nitric oxide-sensitive transcriptional repressor